MSVLTKVAVVLLVVLSLVQTAGLIVFVNKIDPLEKKALAAAEAAGRERTGRLAVEQELAVVSGALNLRVLEADTRAATLRTAFDTSDKKTKESSAALAAAEAAKTKADAERETANAAAQGALATIDTQQKVINEVSTKLSTAQKEGAEYLTRIAALDKELSGTKLTLRRVREDNEALSQKLDAGPARPAAGQQLGEGAGAGGAGGVEAMANLRGVVKDKRTINGTPYATISLGSAQRVTKGMRFRVIDGGNFLGYLDVDSVESDESVGHLSGPALNQVRTGSQVRTQW